MKPNFFPGVLAQLALGAALLMGRVSSASATSVLVWSSGNSQVRTEGVAAWVKSLGGFDSVVGVDSDSMTFAQLNAYDEVLYFSNSSSAPNNVSRGNVLADFADTGKRLVVTTFSWANQGGNTLGGRFVSEAISPYAVDGSSLYSSVTMSSNDGSAFFTGVNTLSGLFHDDVALTAGAMSLATWSDGQSLLAVKNNVVGVNLFPDDSFGTLGGDYRQLFVNALGANIDGQVPEPSTLLLVAVGALALSRRRRN